MPRRHHVWPVRTDEHSWHACMTPEPPEDVDFQWQCPICLQTWVWRRPPRPAAQWVRRDEER